MSDREDSQNPSVHSYGSGDRSKTSGSSSSSSSDSEHPATSPQKKPVDASTCAPSSPVEQVVSVAQPGDEGFIQLDDRLLQTQSSVMQKAQVQEVRNLMPDGYQLTYRAMWKSIIPLHVGTSIGIHYHSIKDLGEFFIHLFKVLFLETYGIMPGQMAPNGHRLLGSFINVFRFLRIPLSLHSFDHKFDVRPGSKETLGFVVVSSHQGRAFLCGLPPSNKKWKDKYPLNPPTSQPFSLEEQPAQSHQSTNQPIHSGELFINVDTFEFENMMGETGHTSQAGLAGQAPEDDQGEEEVAEESLQRKRRKTEEVNQPSHQGAQSSDAGKGPIVPRSLSLMSRSDEELFQAFRSDLNEKVGRIGEEYFARLVKSKDEERTRMEAIMVQCRKDAQAAHAQAEKVEAKWLEHCTVYRQLYAKHDSLLKAAKEADEQAQVKIQHLEAENAWSAEEIARLEDELQKERSERALLAAAWAVQAPEEFAARALPDRETAIRFFQCLYKYEVSAGIVDEIGTFGFESDQYTERRALYGILEQRIQDRLQLPGLKYKFTQVFSKGWVVDSEEFEFH
ncbi:unnamed protein product [Cuscuta campestris]|uniref:Uncharacterized protein n=1 Tax=Cuscuta campestris TaxID=132261 RepID=A0A484LKZ6_9ASTE|nr:unnamed protein product [Cuscuta campestris]